MRIATQGLLISLLSLSLVGISVSAPETQATEKGEGMSLENVKRFSQAMGHIKQYYVRNIEDEALFDDAIRGMLVGLDPHSSYLDKRAFESMKQTTQGEFSGIGIEVTMEEGLIKVITPLDDTPASVAGIKAGDKIVRIDNTMVKGLSLRDAVGKMRGKRGSKVKLLVVRKGETQPLQFNIERNTVKLQSVKSTLLENEFGYVRVSHFQKFTARDLRTAIKELLAKSDGQLHGLILDLRNNPGGLLSAAVKISDTFIDNDQKGEEELIVYTKGRIPGSEYTAFATPGDILKNAPIVVLINEGSASASEIVAGALQDNKRAILIGTKSFGKGSVQTILPLDKERGIKLTTALYYTPSGTSIQAKGIMPDVTVEDVKIDKSKQDKKTRFSESQLRGHLPGLGDTNEKSKTDEATSKNSTQSTSSSEANKALLHKDYQLYQALTMLKGITAMND